MAYIDDTVIIEKAPFECGKCKKEGTMTNVTLRFTKNPVEIVSILKCTNCKTVERHDMENNKPCDKAIKVTAILDSKDEFSRYLYFNRHSTATFYDMNNDDVLFKITSPVSEVTAIGNLLEGKILDLAECGCRSSSKIDRTGCSLSSEMSQKSTLSDNASMMKDCFENPHMRMVILDPMGTTRISKPGLRFPGDLYNDDLSLYNDDKVKHEFIAREDVDMK